MSDTIRDALRLIRNSKQESEALAALARLEAERDEARQALTDPCARAGRHVCGPLPDEDAAGWKARAEAAEADRDKYRDALRDAERAARMALSRLTLARASMRAAVKHDDLAQLEAWLLAADENDWFGEIEAALRDDTALAGAVAPETPTGRCAARRVHPISTDYFVQCERNPGHDGDHANDMTTWRDDSKYALPAVPSGDAESVAPRESLAPLDVAGILWVAAIDRVPIEERVEWVETVRIRVEEIDRQRAAVSPAARGEEHDG